MRRRWGLLALAAAVGLCVVGGVGCDREDSAGQASSANAKAYNTGTGRDDSGPESAATDQHLGSQGLRDHWVRTSGPNPYGTQGSIVGGTTGVGATRNLGEQAGFIGTRNSGTP